MCQRQGHGAQKAADCRAERHQRSAVALELRNKFPYFHCPPWGPLMAMEQLEWTVAISGIHHSSPGEGLLDVPCTSKGRVAMKEESTKKRFLLFVWCP